MIVLLVVMITLLLATAAVQPRPTKLSSFELQRRSDAVSLEWMRATAYRDLMSIKKVKEAALLVIVVALLISWQGWLLGTIVSIVVALEYGAVARFGMFRTYIQKIYDRYEKFILEYVIKYQSALRFIRSVVPNVSGEASVASREELAHLLSQLKAIVTHEEKDLMLHALEFDTKTVEGSMTPRSMIKQVRYSEVLGPLVLDELHKTGHSRFPVVGETDDDVLGMLYIQDLVTLRSKESARVSEVMSSTVYFINEKKKLSYALAAFLKTHNHLFIVVNEFAEVVGIISLEDVIEALIGRNIVDELDTIDNLRREAVSKNRDRENV